MTKNKTMKILTMREKVEVEEVVEVQIAKLNQILFRPLINLQQVNKMKTAKEVCIQSLNRSKEMKRMMRGFHGTNLKSKLLEVILGL